MRQIALPVLLLAVLSFGTVDAQEPEDFERAKALSAQLSKPLLLEFVHED